MDKVVYISRLVYIAVCCMWLGGAVNGYIQAQTTGERIVRLETEVQSTAAEVEVLKARQVEITEDISMLHGIGIAVGGLLGFLQVIQLVASKRT